MPFPGVVTVGVKLGLLGVIVFSWGHPNGYFSSGWETLNSDTFRRKFPKIYRRASRADQNNIW